MDAGLKADHDSIRARALDVLNDNRAETCAATKAAKTSSPSPLSSLAGDDRGTTRTPLTPAACAVVAGGALELKVRREEHDHPPQSGNIGFGVAACL